MTVPAEQLELLFEAPPEPPSAPLAPVSAPETAPPRRPTRPESAESGPAAARSPRKSSVRRPQAAPRAVPGIQKTPPEAAGRRDGAVTHESVAIPALCPVVNRPVCYRADCRHWSAGCAHPEAVTRRPRRRNRR